MLLPPARAGLTEADGEFRRSILEQLNVQVQITADIGEVFTDVRCDLWAIITNPPQMGSRNSPHPFSTVLPVLTVRQRQKMANKSVQTQ